MASVPSGGNPQTSRSPMWCVEDIDGFVIIGHLPLGKGKFLGRLDLRPHKFTLWSSVEMLRSCNSQMREHFKNWLIIKAGYVGGHNFGFIIDQDSEFFRKRWIEFLQHPDTVLDPENLKFAYGGLSRQLKSSDNCELILTDKILSGFK